MSDTTPADERREPVLPPSVDETTTSDQLEGSYTEIDGEAPRKRGLPGAYTRTDGAVDDESAVGDYVSTAEHPITHDPSARRGKFARVDQTERRKGHGSQPST